jgi:hypothetical protein
MKRAAILVSAVALFTAAVYAQAPQAKPSFAGKWTLVPDPNAPAAAGGRGGRGGGFGGLGDAFSATQDDKTLTVTTNNPQMGEMKAVYALDGSETKNPLSFNGNSIDRNSKAKCDGGKLVVTTTTDFNGNAMESTMTWSLDASGNLVVESMVNFGGNGPTTTKATYKKSDK